MILDSSAIVAIFKRETGHDLLKSKLDKAASVAIGAPTAVETAIVLSRSQGSDQSTVLDAFLRRIDAEVIAFTDAHYAVATEAMIRYGRGFHPKANLNFGDCLSYATAKLARDTLLFVGSDFLYTDIQPA